MGEGQYARALWGQLDRDKKDLNRFSFELTGTTVAPVTTMEDAATVDASDPAPVPALAMSATTQRLEDDDDVMMADESDDEEEVGRTRKRDATSLPHHLACRPLACMCHRQQRRRRTTRTYNRSGVQSKLLTRWSSQ